MKRVEVLLFSYFLQKKKMNNEVMELFNDIIKKEIKNGIPYIEKKVFESYPFLVEKEVMEVFQLDSFKIANVVCKIIEKKFPYLRCNIFSHYRHWYTWFFGINPYYSVWIALNDNYSFPFDSNYERKKVKDEEMVLIEKLAGVKCEQIKHEVNQCITNYNASERFKEGFYWKIMSESEYYRYSRMVHLLFDSIHLRTEREEECFSSSTSIFSYKQVDEKKKERTFKVFIDFY